MKDRGRRRDAAAPVSFGEEDQLTLTFSQSVFM